MFNLMINFVIYKYIYTRLIKHAKNRDRPYTTHIRAARYTSILMMICTNITRYVYILYNILHALCTMLSVYHIKKYSPRKTPPEINYFFFKNIKWQIRDFSIAN